MSKVPAIVLGVIILAAILFWMVSCATFVGNVVSPETSQDSSGTGLTEASN